MGVALVDEGDGGDGDAAEVDLLLGDAAKARRELGWTPKVGFNDLVKMMVDADLRLAKRELAAKNADVS